MAGLFVALEDAGKASVKELGALYARYCEDVGFSFEIVEAVASGSKLLERGGAWLLEKWVEEGGGLNSEECGLLASCFDGFTSWEGRYYLCRLFCVEGMAALIGIEEVEFFLRESCSDKVPFVRACALSAYCRLGRDHLRYLAEAKEMVRNAKDTEQAKSVLSRLRHIDSILKLDE